MGKLDGKVAIVTGAARGLGRAYAKRLAGLGAMVAVTDLNLRSYEEFETEAKDMTADSTVAAIEAMGGSTNGIEVDVAHHEAVDAQWSHKSSASGAGSISWSRMPAAVEVGPWTRRPAPSIRHSYGWLSR
jgi:NAD(P)-dependent dehydrogenase (short-subunit alcohol dehydrogenase family)